MLGKSDRLYRRKTSVHTKKRPWIQSFDSGGFHLMAVISCYRSIFSRINSMMAVIASVGAGSWCITQRNSSGSG